MISPFFKKLLLSRMIDIGNGEFKIFHKNYFLGSVEALILLREELKKKGMLDILYKFGENISKEIFNYFKKIGGEKEESVKFWLNMITMAGIGDIELVEFDTESGEVLVNCSNSPIASYYVKEKKKEKVDELLAGIIGGFFSEYFGKKVKCEEVSCIADGKRICQFRIKQ